MNLKKEMSKWTRRVFAAASVAMVVMGTVACEDDFEKEVPVGGAIVFTLDVEDVDNRCFKTTETYIIFVFCVWCRQFILEFIAAECRFGHCRATRIAKTKGTAYLVKGFPCRIISCFG